MKKSTKGALAAGAAAALLLGGAGSLAYWTADGVITGGSVTSGHLKLDADAPGSWSLNGTPVADISAVLIVPGDELEFTGSYTIDAAGDNLQADVTVTGGAASGDLAAHLTTPTVEYTVDGATATSITEDNDGDTLEATVSFGFPFGATANNASNVAGGLTVDLANLAVTLTQTDATP